MESDITTRYSSGRERNESLSSPKINLSSIKLAIIGGRPKTCHAMLRIFQDEYGLKSYVEICCSSKKQPKYPQLRDKLINCDLVLVMTGSLDHAFTDLVHKLQRSPIFSGKVLWLNKTNTSGVLQEIIPQLSEFQTT